MQADRLETEDVYVCWLVWKRAEDGGRPYLVAVDTTESLAKRHVRMVKEEAKALGRGPVFVTVESSFLNHAYGETMGEGYDRAKALSQEIRRATIDELEKARTEATRLAAELAKVVTERDEARSEAEYLRAGIEDGLAINDDRRESFLRRLLDNVDACGSIHAAAKIANATHEAKAREAEFVAALKVAERAMTERDTCQVCRASYEPEQLRTHCEEHMTPDGLDEENRNACEDWAAMLATVRAALAKVPT